jgi:hypothetical protein
MKFFKKFDYKLGLSDVINFSLAVIGTVIAINVGYNTDQLKALNSLNDLNNKNLNTLKDLEQTSNNNLNTLKDLTITSNKNLDALNKLFSSYQKQLLVNKELLESDNQSLMQLSKAVDAIILSDTQLIYVNKKLQSQTDSLINQTTLFSKSVSLNQESVMKAKHRDSVEFLLQSYELEDLIDSIQANYKYITNDTDSLTAISTINKVLGLLRLGFRNYCINDDNVLYTRWGYAFGKLSSVKYDISRGYPPVAYSYDFMERMKDPRKDVLYYTLQVIMDDEGGFVEIINSVEHSIREMQGSYINGFERSNLGIYR